MEIPRELLKEIPKADLHVHLDGSLRVSTLIDLAKKQKITLPTSNQDDLTKLVKSGLNCRNLTEYLQGFEVTLSVMQEAQALYRIAYELAEDAAEENIWY